MFLSVQEQERLMIYAAGKLAIERKERGLKLNLPEATAVPISFMLEGALNGETIADLMEARRHVLSRDDVARETRPGAGIGDVARRHQLVTRAVPVRRKRNRNRFGSVLL